MVTKIKIKCIHCGHIWETKSQAVMVCCTSCSRKTPARSRPERLPVTAPPGLKKVKARIGQLPDQDVETLRGPIISKAVGRVIQTETFTVQSSTRKHTIFPLRGNLLYKSKGVTNNCELCGLKLKEDKTSVLFDGKTPAHSFCVLDRALQECNGDIHAAEHSYELPYAALVQRGKKLLKEGKLTEIIV